MVVLATAATVIASQAVITGAFSMTQQAIQLGLLPRLMVRRTSEVQSGQIYIPRINWSLLVLVLFVVFVFRNSSALAGAYGIAVTGTMVVTAILAFIVLWRCWHWRPWQAAALVAPLLLIDVVFLAANLLKVVEGGWMPLAIGAAIVLIMLTWRRGSRLVAEKTKRSEVALMSLLNSLERRPADLRVPGTAVFLTAHADNAPTALLHNVKHNKVLHEHNVILTIASEDVPYVRASERVVMTPLSATFLQVLLRFGYMEQPNVGKTLPLCRERGWKFEVMQTSFYLSRRLLTPAERSPMPVWQNRLFIGLANIADDAARYFNLPTDRVVEIGTQISV
jgi:KUP system potassium uptake protein